MKTPLDPRIQIGAVSLIVSDLDRSLDYYQARIGLRILDKIKNHAQLGANGQVLLKLTEQPDARRIHRVTGLYHFALRVPTRQDLGLVIQNLIRSQTPVDGAADHLVSEALYLSDPDGHGIEIYRDRPRADWYDNQGNLQMDTLALDIDSILAETQEKLGASFYLPPKTDMGHVHLHVSNLAQADAFYLDLIGFERPLASRLIPTASFISAGGYHHHIGLNTWAGVGAPAAPADAARMLHFEIIFPNQDALTPVLDRLEDANIDIQENSDGWLIEDPSKNKLVLRI